MFRKEADFEAFERVMVQSHERQPIRVTTLGDGNRRALDFHKKSVRNQSECPVTRVFRSSSASGKDIVV